MARVTGIEEVLENLAKETKAIIGGSAKGVVKAALLVMKESQKLTPIDSGNLRNSRFLISNIPGLAPVATKEGAFKGDQAAEMGSDHATVKAAISTEVKNMATAGPTAAVGYSALYALSVHENPRAGKTGKPNAAKSGAWKFLENPLKTLSSRILEIIRKDAAIS